MGNHTALTLCSLFVIKLMMSMYDILKLKYSVTESYLFLKLTFFYQVQHSHSYLKYYSRIAVFAHMF